MEKGLISIDRWGDGSQAYFLTHLHADHTKGLSSRWSRGPLFCSRVSARLLPAKFPGFDLSLVRVLEVGVTHAIYLLSPSTGAETRVLVTPIDAHHCPGAVMYLFRGEFGCVLHTGDFRWELMSKRTQSAKQSLLDALGGTKVDVLYLDNTYCHPSFLFPPREVAAQQVVDIINQHPDHEVIIGIDTVGKEDLLLHISKSLSTKIWVWPERLQIMHLLGFDDIFTTKTCLTKVRAVPRYSLNLDTLKSLNALNPTIGIMPSGIPWVVDVKAWDGSLGSTPARCNKNKGMSNSSLQVNADLKCLPRKLSDNAYSVLYSEHACFNEIQEFTKLVQPSTVTGIVSSSFCYVNPRHYFGYRFRANQLPNEALRKHIKEIAEAVEVSLSGSGVAYRKSKKLMEKREKHMQASCLSVRRSRVRVLRRDMHGSKVVEADGGCSGNLDVAVPKPCVRK